MKSYPKHKPTRLKGKALDLLHKEIRKRDRNKCVVCGTTASMMNPYPAHHIVYKSQGGDDSLENLVSLCPTCHAQAHLHNINGWRMGSKSKVMEWFFNRIDELNKGV